MSKKLGLCISSKNMEQHVFGIVKAAAKADVFTDLFLTGEGVLISQHPLFPDILALSGRVGICELSYMGYKFKKEKIPQLRDKDFVTQMRNADLVENCDRYINL